MICPPEAPCVSYFNHSRFVFNTTKLYIVNGGAAAEYYAAAPHTKSFLIKRKIEHLPFLQINFNRVPPKLYVQNPERPLYLRRTLRTVTFFCPGVWRRPDFLPRQPTTQKNLHSDDRTLFSMVLFQWQDRLKNFSVGRRKQPPETVFLQTVCQKQVSFAGYSPYRRAISAA